MKRPIANVDESTMNHTRQQDTLPEVMTQVLSRLERLEAKTEDKGPYHGRQAIDAPPRNANKKYQATSRPNE